MSHRRVAFVLAMAVGLAVVIPAPAMAARDLTPPTLDSIALREPGPFYDADSITLDFVVSDDSAGPIDVFVVYRDGIGAYRYDSSKTASLTFPLGTWRYGHPTIDWITVTDAAGNASAYKPDGTLSQAGIVTTHTLDLSVLSFEFLPPEPIAITAPVPTMTGFTAAFNKLTAQTAGWGPAPVSFTYQWNRDSVPILDAIGESYWLTADDADHSISVTVSGQRANYLSSSNTSAPVTIALLTLSNGGPSEIVGVGRVDTVLRADAFWTWRTGYMLSYQWTRDGEPIEGATARSYTAGLIDLGTEISVITTVSKPGYASRSATTSPGVTITPGEFVGTWQQISGGFAVGRTLKPVVGGWTPEPADFTYEWFAAPVPDVSPGAYSFYKVGDGPTYVPTAHQLNQYLWIRVMATREGYSTGWAESVPAQVGPGSFSAPSPTISGLRDVGQTLRAVTTGWSPSPDQFTYRWLRAGTPISGATAATYKLAAADAGASITVEVGSAKAGYANAVKKSAAVIIGKQLTTTAPKIGGSPVVGATLSVTPGAWGPSPVTLTYSWYRNGAAIPGATAATYKVQLADAGAKLMVGVTGSKLGYTTIIRGSAAVPVPFLQFRANPVPTITGSPRPGGVLVAGASAWSPAPTGFTYQWKRDGAVISGATAASYPVAAGDAGKRITVTVSGLRLGYQSLAGTSSATLVERAFAAAPAPIVLGAPRVGSVLTANVGVWNPIPDRLVYVWKRNGQAIQGAGAKTYMLVAADKGTKITVAVAGYKTGFTAAAKTSLPLLIG